MTITKTQIQNLLGVSRAWASTRIRRHPTHSELVEIVREWKAQEPECQERARWSIDEDETIRFAWRPDFLVHIDAECTPYIFVRGVLYPTDEIVSRFLDGWRIDDMASDYKCDRLQIEAAIAFELKARAT